MHDELPFAVQTAESLAAVKDKSLKKNKIMLKLMSNRVSDPDLFAEDVILMETIVVAFLSHF